VIIANPTSEQLQGLLDPFSNDFRNYAESVLVYCRPTTSKVWTLDQVEVYAANGRKITTGRTFEECALEARQVGLTAVYVN
jgi:hypothetical protein